MKVGVSVIPSEVPQVTIWIFIQYTIPEQIYNIYFAVEWLAFLRCIWNSSDSNSGLDPH